MKSGDIIGFSGRGFVSGLIQVGTFSLPCRGISHVGVVSVSNGIPFVYESTSFGRPACEIQKVKVSGVQCHRLDDLLDFVDKQSVWHYPLQRELYEHEDRRLGYYLDRHLGVPYDYFGAGRSGGFFWNLLQTALHNEDLSNIFCSELIADAFSDLGIFNTVSSSRWNPNKLLRTLQRRGIVNTPRRLK
jgi:hypothetical protein